ncbi:Globin-2 B chain [Trichinella spiralis]|uniref:Globin-2 B chain n=1 Tax=Trichinella spiralis TaxID=6334 RepID=A0ABR3KC28_TRISP
MFFASKLKRKRFLKAEVQKHIPLWQIPSGRLFCERHAFSTLGGVGENNFPLGCHLHLYTQPDVWFVNFCSKFSSATGSRWVEIRGCRAWAAAWESGFDFAVIPESPSPVCTELTCGVVSCIAEVKQTLFIKMGNRQPSNGRPAVPVETDVVVDTILPDDLQLLADPNTKRLLQMTWPADFADLYELGLEICQELFKQMAPALVPRHRLSMGDVVTAEEQSLGVRLRTEALRFVQVLHLALINCDDLRNLKNHLNKIGKIYLLRGLDGSHPQLFKYSVVRTMEKRLRNKFDLDDASKQKKSHATDASRRLTSRFIMKHASKKFVLPSWANPSRQSGLYKKASSTRG